MNRATWIWKTEEVICNDAQADQFVAFAQKNGITRVYIHINPDIPPQTMAIFIAKCTSSGSRGIAVEALMGDAAWILDPQSHESLQIRLRWVADYQRGYAHDARVLFCGLHLDVEPWQLDNWRGPDQPSLVRQWLACLQYLKGWAQSQQPLLPVAADLPFWLHTLRCPDSGETLDVAMMRILDGAVFMTYRNSPQGLVDIASDALLACWRCGKGRESVWLAVETVPSEEGQHISYHGLGGRKLHGDLGCLEGGHGLRRTQAHEEWYGGIAIHDYHTWLKMEE